MGLNKDKFSMIFLVAGFASILFSIGNLIEYFSEKDIYIFLLGSIPSFVFGILFLILYMIEIRHKGYVLYFLFYCVGIYLMSVADNGGVSGIFFIAYSVMPVVKKSNNKIIILVFSIITGLFVLMISYMKSDIHITSFFNMIIMAFVLFYIHYALYHTEIKPDINYLKFKLTEKEIEYIRLISEGLSYAEIAYEFNLKESTVKKTAASVRVKMNVPNNAKLIKDAMNLKIIT